MKTLAKENNAGGLSFEHYDDNMNIISVVTGLEFADQPGQGIEDIKTYGTEWDWTDVGGQVSGYSHDGNTDDSEYEVEDMIDDSEYTKIVAKWDGKELTLWKDDMGYAACRYFGVEND
jgi:hypothetical protein